MEHMHPRQSPAVFTGLLRGEQLKLNVVLQSDEKIVRETNIRME